ncbi:MAG TPA: hypothetical protein VKA30_01145 [Actinomycetota bacterium]|nr:hypothetical protein [Actinomycetota bacterium]
MSVDERSRYELYQRLEQVLGPKEASTLMEHLPPLGWGDVATKQDLDRLEQRLEDRLTASFRAELVSQTRTMILAMLGTVVSLAGVTIAALKLV